MDESKNGSTAPGAGTPKPLSLEQVREYVKRDLASTINLLDAIYKDQNTVEMLSDVLFGRYLNAKHKEELDKQTKLTV